MSAEWAAGMIALSTAIAPPTGITARPAPAGQASGITAPRSITGTRSSSRICRRTDSTFLRSASDRGSIASASPAGEPRSASFGGGE
jgi:hypothetical protein